MVVHLVQICPQLSGRKHRSYRGRLAVRIVHGPVLSKETNTVISEFTSLDNEKIKKK